MNDKQVNSDWNVRLPAQEGCWWVLNQAEQADVLQRYSNKRSALQHWFSRHSAVKQPRTNKTSAVYQACSSGH